FVRGSCGDGIARMCQREILAVLFRQTLWSAMPVANHVESLPRCDHCAVSLVENLIRKSDRAAPRLRHGSTNAQHVVELRRMLVRATRFRHHHETVILDFHFLVAESQLPHQFHARHLEPHEEIRVVDHSHLVGFGVAHANSRFARDGHWPRHSGLRFSKKDDKPSRKSTVRRISALSRIATARSRSISFSFERKIMRFVSRKLVGLEAISDCASSRADSISFSCGTNCVTSPRRCASAASNIFPVSKSSRVIFSPACRKRKTETTAGRKPMRTSV